MRQDLRPRRSPEHVRENVVWVRRGLACSRVALGLIVPAFCEERSSKHGCDRRVHSLLAHLFQRVAARPLLAFDAGLVGERRSRDPKMDGEVAVAVEIAPIQGSASAGERLLRFLSSPGNCGEAASKRTQRRLEEPVFAGILQERFDSTQRFRRRSRPER